MGFAVWVGRMAAAGAAALAVMWLWQAKPQDASDQPVGQAEINSCRVRAQIIAIDISQMPRVTHAQIEAAQRRVEECGPRWTPRDHWDETLVLRGLMAGGAAVVLLLISAMGARMARHD